MPRINYEEFRAAHEETDALDVDFRDGSTFHVPPPMFWPDGTFDLLRGRSVEDLDLRAFAISVLGEDAYHRYVALGGTGAALFGMLQKVHGEGSALGESSASSDSSESTTRPSKPTSSASTASTSSTSEHPA